MKSLVVLPLILMLGASHCFAFSKPKPQPQKVKAEIHVPVSKLFVNGVVNFDVVDIATKHDSMELRKEDKYMELLNKGLARKKQKNRNV